MLTEARQHNHFTSNIIQKDGPSNPFHHNMSTPNVKHTSNYKIEKNRLDSFRNWQVDFLKPEDLAKSGFYYKGPGDRTACAFCDVEISDWERDDVPAKEHAGYSRRCPFVKNIPCGNVPLGEESNILFDNTLISNAPAQHFQFATIDSRLKTYENWPLAMRQRPKQLAEAGFFYVGQGDQVVCYYCNGGLKNWETDDEPWTEHAKWFPTCHFLRLKKSQEFIDKAKDTVEPGIVDSEPAVEVEVEKEEEEESGENSRLLCKVCFSKEVAIVFLPCGHMVACEDCALALEKCAVCRKSVKHTMRAFLS